jgi:hypothetical protein
MKHECCFKVKNNRLRLTQLQLVGIEVNCVYTQSQHMLSFSCLIVSRFPNETTCLYVPRHLLSES